MFLNVKGIKEEKKGNNFIIITSLGRLYLNKAFCEKSKKEKAVAQAYSKLDKNYPNNKLPIKKGVVFEFEKVLDNIYDILDLYDYFVISTDFMEYIIEAKEQFWNKAIQNFRCKLSVDDKYSLLKPVFFRYKNLSRNRENLIKVRNNLKNYREYKKMVLYNIKYELIDGKLRLLDKFWIDLTEIYYGLYECLSLGNIKNFDRVEINIKGNFIKIKLEV